VVCLYTPKPYYGAGAWFEDFREPPLEGTRALLERDPDQNSNPTATFT
jgi:predicted phosphoribosyltransferase